MWLEIDRDLNSGIDLGVPSWSRLGRGVGQQGSGYKNIDFGDGCYRILYRGGEFD